LVTSHSKSFDMIDKFKIGQYELSGVETWFFDDWCDDCFFEC